MTKTKVLAMVSILLLMLVSACSPQSSTPTADLTLEVINLQTTPTLDHWLPHVADCADEIREFGIFTRILPISEIGSEPNDLIIRLGGRTEDDPHVVVLGSETLRVFAGSDVPLSSLSLESLQKIYSGELSNWGQVPELMDDGINIDLPIQTLSYPDEHSLSILFSDIFLEEKAILSQPIVFSTLGRLIQILEEEPYAIGYLLESQLPEPAKLLEITGIDSQATQQLVLAVTLQEPKGKLRQFLLCLQETP